jgi:hypothetical protein
MKLAVIGNGPSALKEKRGDEIDMFPLVLRFNSYRIPTFEEFVGTKTDIWVTTDIFPAWHKSYSDVYLCSFARTEDNPLFQKLKGYYPDLKMFPEWAWQETIDGTGYHAPSSGAVAVTYFMRNFDIYLWGFDNFSGPKHHYGDDVEKGTNHKIENEKPYFDKLIKEGKVRVL